MNYRSVQEMASTIRNGLSRLPEDIDLVVGIPRSGVLAASLIALHTNLKCISLDGFSLEKPIRTGSIRNARHPHVSRPRDAHHILLVDDSASTGASMKAAHREIRLSGYSGAITTCAIYLTPDCVDIDVHFEVVPQIRVFEWNLMHRDLLSECCVDMDGVLCRDPTDAENDDGPRYVAFLESASPLLIPSYRVGRIVTSRLEKYRDQTLMWLRKHRVEFGVLDMVDLPNAETRRRLNIHAEFKAKIYSADPTMRLFIESDRLQAMEIARRAGKPALSVSTQELFSPGLTLPYARQASRRWAARGLRLLHSLLGSSRTTP